MPPKKSFSGSKAKKEPDGHQKPQDDDAGELKTNGTADTNKRKAHTDSDISSKAQRRSGRSGSSRPSQEQLLNFLLSKEAKDLTRPEDETEDLETRSDIKTYSTTVLNPFEELMCAIILSRPISHRLGLRTIRTVLNEPYVFTSAKAIKDAGSDKQHQALWDARTQHKDKTAQQLGNLAEVVLDKFTSDDDTDGTSLGRVLEASTDLSEIHETLKSSIKGLGPTGLDIFTRRVQWLWDPLYPYIDGRTVDSLRKFSLPYDAEQLSKVIDENWKKLDTKHLAGDNDAQRKRRAFVVVLERVTGGDLEGKVETLISHAAK